MNRRLLCIMQAKNRDEKLEAAKTKQESCQTTYEEVFFSTPSTELTSTVFFFWVQSKSDFSSAYDELEGKRDKVYEQTVQQLQEILGAMQPIWAGGSVGAARDSSAGTGAADPEVEAVNVVNSDSDAE